MLKAALEINVGGKVNLSDPIVPLIVRHAAYIINVSRVRENGRTAWQLMKGRRSRTPLLPFGEVVMFKIPKTNKRIWSFEDKWEKGVWAGVVSRSGEHTVATAEGIFKVSTIKRRPADQRWSFEMLQIIVGSLQEPTPGSGMRRIQAHLTTLREPSRTLLLRRPKSRRRALLRSSSTRSESTAARQDARVARPSRQAKGGIIIHSDVDSALNSCSGKTPSRNCDSSVLPRGG